MFIKKEIEVGKDSSEIADALGELIKDIKAGKDVGAIIAENLAGLMSAIDGYENLDDEFKSSARNATLAYAGLKIAEALESKSEASA